MISLAEAIGESTHARKLRLLDAQLQRIRVIKHIVAGHYYVSIAQLDSRSRVWAVAWSRHLAIWMSLHFTYLDGNEIALAFDRAHSAVIEARKAILDRCETEPKLAREVISLMDRVNLELKNL